MAEVKIAVPGIKKLVEVVASGIGATAGSMLAPWNARQEAKAQIIRAGADAHSRMIEAEGDKIASLIAAETAEAHTLLTSPDAGSLRINELVQRGIEFQGRKRYLNTQAVVSEAADELSDKEVPDQEPDHDWTARFFDGVKDVSSGEMRSIWARLLAGEVESPGRTSLRTLDILRNMTQADAKVFAYVCGFAFSIPFINAAWIWRDPDPDPNTRRSISFDAALRMEECGLVSVGGGMLNRILAWTPLNDEEWFIVLLYQDNYLLITKDPRLDDTNILQISGFLFTTPGCELFRFVQHSVPRREYLRYFASSLKNEQGGCQLFRLEDVMSLPDGSLNYLNRVLINPSE